MRRRQDAWETSLFSENGEENQMQSTNLRRGERVFDKANEPYMRLPSSICVHRQAVYAAKGPQIRPTSLRFNRTTLDGTGVLPRTREMPSEIPSEGERSHVEADRSHV